MLPRTLTLALLSFMAVSLLAGCGPAPESAPVNLPSPTVKDNTGMSASPAPTSPASETVEVTQAKQDLAQRLSVNSSQIELVSFQSITWPDGSLGCPQPGMLYTQALVEGYLIQLRAAGRVYEYHGARAGAPFLCEK